MSKPIVCDSEVAGEANTGVANARQRKQSFEAARPQSASLKKLNGAPLPAAPVPFQSMLATTAPKLGCSTMMSLPSPPVVLPGVVVTSCSRGISMTPGAGGVGHVGVTRLIPGSLFSIVTSNVTRILPGMNAPTADAW